MQRMHRKMHFCSAKCTFFLQLLKEETEAHFFIKKISKLAYKRRSYGQIHFGVISSRFRLDSPHLAGINCTREFCTMSNLFWCSQPVVAVPDQVLDQYGIV